MSTSRLTFFATPDEFNRELVRLAGVLNLHFLIIGTPLNDKLVKCRVIASDETLKHTNIRIFKETTSINKYSNVASWKELFKTVSLTNPSLVDNTLFLGELAAKSNWFEEQGAVDIFDGVELLKTIRRRVMLWDGLKVFAKNVNSKKEEQHYKYIKCTAEVKKFFDSGGLLRQQGVKNVEFFVR